MSYRGAGRIADVPTELLGGLAVFRTLDDLTVLGHIERPDNSAWRVCPPVLAGLPGRRDEPARAVLCGARTAGVLTSLHAVCRNSAVEIVEIETNGRPPTIQVTAPTTTAIAAAAAESKLAFQREASFTLLACIPTIREWPRTPCTMVAGRVETVRRFSRSKMGWVTTDLREATSAKAGFFRIKRDWDWVSLLKTGVNECAYIDDRAGRVAVAAKLRAVSWSAGACELGLPSQLYPPAIIARALVLCTGALPHFEPTARRIIFSGISPDILNMTLALTGLRLA
jgi:hypothetical protein